MVLDLHVHQIFYDIGNSPFQRLAVAIYEAVFDVERPILSKLFQKALALRMLVIPVK